MYEFFFSGSLPNAITRAMFPFFIHEVLLLVIGMKLLRQKKKIAILGTAGVVAGLVFFNKVFASATSCSLSCAATETPSYAFLQRNEARMTVVGHPLISAVEVNYLPSNSPNEDRFVAGSSRELGAGLFAVLDGHSGYQCSEHLRQKLLDVVMKTLAADGLVADPHLDKHNLNTSASGFHQNNTVNLSPLPRSQNQNIPLALEESLKRAFLTLDKETSDAALYRMNQIKQGHSINKEGVKSDLMKALSGACALLAVITEKMLSVASTGDCRAVIGTRGGESGEWTAVPMSVDQNAQNKDEVARLQEAHPGEKNTVITMGRLLGNLMPLRSFGDVQYKWSVKEFGQLLQVPMFYHTPPYLTAEPVVTHRELEGGDRFVVLATDGLWERMSNELVVRTVGQVLEPEEHSPKSGLASMFSSKQQCCSENAATRLLWESLGGKEETVGKLLKIPAEYRRALRDDITIIVVHLRHDK